MRVRNGNNNGYGGDDNDNGAMSVRSQHSNTIERTREAHNTEMKKIGKRKYAKKSTNIDLRPSQCKGEFQVWRKSKGAHNQQARLLTAMAQRLWP